MSSRRRRLLLLAQHFPPSSEVAGKPTARLVRYLDQYGWDPTILTIPESNIVVPLDYAGYADVLRNIRIERVARWPRLLDLAREAQALRKRIQKAKPGIATIPIPLDDFVWGGSFQRMPWIVRALSFPDNMAGWTIPAIIRAQRLISAGHFDAVLTVSPPHSTHLAGWALSRLNPSIPWIAQFHDPWVWSNTSSTQGSFFSGATEVLEQQVILSADDVLLATEEARDCYIQRYPSVPATKFGVLPNGYDPIDFPKADPQPREGRHPLRFLHVGTVYGGRNPLPFLQGLAFLVDQGLISPESVEVEFLGDCEPAASVRAAMAGSRLEPSISFTGQVDHPEALRKMMAADVLLLLAQQQPLQIPAKLYEYLHAGRFVLAFTEGATACLIEQTSVGRVVGPNDDVVAALHEVVQMHQAGLLTNRPPADGKLRPYQACELAAVLAQRLELVVNAKHSSGSQAGE